MLILSLFLLSLVNNHQAFNVLVYSPSFGGSHTNFMARFADTLTEVGHNVTFLVPVTDEGRKHQLGVKKTKDVVIVEQDEEMRRHVKQIDDDLAQYWLTDTDSSNAEDIFAIFHENMVYSCENLMRNKEAFEQLKTRNFDVAIFEPLSVCGLGYAHALGVKKMILASSCALYDGTVGATGEALDFSHVPGMMSRSGEKMTFFERLENYRIGQASVRMQYKMWDREERVYQKHFGAAVPEWRDLMPAASVFFTNSIPYVDFPRAVTQKTIPIGGISVDLDSIRAQKLPIEWSTVLDERPHSMLISFGSMVRSKDMPIEWRNSLLEAIKSEPNVTFIWKYESDDVNWAKGVNNVFFSKWIPQTALLNDDRLTAFLTHGGLGSTNELAHLGKPALMVPVFGDQDRNANMLARHHGVLVLHKSELGNTRVVKESIRAVLHDENIKKNAEKLAELLVNQPLKPKDQVIKYTEFVAKFGPFPEMDSYGRKLNFVQRNLLDVYAYIGASYLLVLGAVFVVARFIISLISRIPFRVVIVKKEKKLN